MIGAGEAEEIDADLSDVFGPLEAAALFVDIAREILADVDEQNREATGDELPFVTLVDGLTDELLQKVVAGSLVERRYDILPAVVAAGFELLWDHSPVKTGAYQESHELYADGQQIAWVTMDWRAVEIPAGVRELVFMTELPYARPIEQGRSNQAPDGVYHVVAAMLDQEYGRVASVAFDYREFAGVEESPKERAARPYSPRDLRQPAIVIRPL